MVIFRRRSSSSYFDADQFKRPPLRHCNGFSEHRDGNGKYTRVLQYLKWTWLLIFYFVLAVAFILSTFSLLVYVNCSGRPGFEIIPKSQPLCHDVYQMLQTGRVSSFTWDWKASVEESALIFHDFLLSAGDWIKNFDVVEIKERALDVVLAGRDALVAFPNWLYQNGDQIVRSLAKAVLEFVSCVCKYAVEAAQRVSGAIVGYSECIKKSTVELIAKIPNSFGKMKSG